MPADDIALYVDSSALAKLYVPDRASDAVDECLRAQSRLMISELVITEVLAAIAREKREGRLDAGLTNRIRDALMADAESGSFLRLQLDPAVHRAAERLMLIASHVLRVPDALHLALAASGSATHVMTFDPLMRDAATHLGLHVIELDRRTID